MFNEAWAQRVQLHGSFDTLDKAKNGPYVDPIVVVTLRANGTVESIVLRRSSGVPAIDEAVKQVIMELVPYTPLPAELSADYDSVEITRMWRFSSGLRLVKVGR